MRAFARASAPVRLDFAGGWTDVAPFAVEEGGMVVSAAIGLRARAEVEPRAIGWLLEGEEGPPIPFDEAAALSAEGRFALQRAALRRCGMPPCRLATRSEAPSGSGLGSSAAIGVALVSALDAVCEVPRDRHALAIEAFEMEAVDAALPGGKQDQFAAALGGFNRLEFTGDDVRATPLTLDPGFMESLAAHMLVCYTGVSRVSGRTIERVMGAYRSGNGRVGGALRALRDIARRTADALLAGDLAVLGRCLTENWTRQQELDDGMRTPEMARLEAAIRDAGVLGAKAAGAGAGGSMIFLVRDPVAGAAAARSAGARTLPLRWDFEGARVEELR